MNKDLFIKDNTKYYLLGKGKDDNYYWLQEALWKAGWFWQFGNVYIGSADGPNLKSSVQFNKLFLDKQKKPANYFADFFVDSVMDRVAIREFIDYMLTAYYFKNIVNLYHYGYRDMAIGKDLDWPEESDIVNRDWYFETFLRMERLISPEDF